MSGAEDDGGPAFPVADGVAGSNAGMTLRDWFAGQALPAVVADHLTSSDPNDPIEDLALSIAHECFVIARLMIEARK